MPGCDVGASERLRFQCVLNTVTGSSEDGEAGLFLCRHLAENMKRQMDRIDVKLYRNICETVENTTHLVLSANFYYRNSQFFVCTRGQILFAQDDTCRVTSGNPLDSRQKVFPVQRSIGDAKNIRHIHNRSAQAEALLRTYPDTSTQSCGHRRFQTARHPWQFPLLCRYICFRDLRYRWKHRQKPW